VKDKKAKVDEKKSNVQMSDAMRVLVERHREM